MVGRQNGVTFLSLQRGKSLIGSRPRVLVGPGLLSVVVADAASVGRGTSMVVSCPLILVSIRVTVGTDAFATDVEVEAESGEMVSVIRREL